MATGWKRKSSLAIRADPKKFQLVRHGFEFIFRRNPVLDFLRKTFFNLDYFGTIRANQMMMMAVVVFADEFKPRCAVTEIKSFHHGHFFEQMHGTINRRQIAITFWKRRKNFLVRQWMRMCAQNLQNR